MKAKEHTKLALKTKEAQVNALEFLKRAIENQFTPVSNDLLLYMSLKAVYRWVCPMRRYATSVTKVWRLKKMRAMRKYAGLTTAMLN